MAGIRRCRDLKNVSVFQTDRVRFPKMHAPDRDPARVQAMFDRVARKYRLANTILSGGLDYFWRKRAAAIVKSWAPSRILDVATGSGDLARTIEFVLPQSEVTGA